jgi:DnaJ-class molecular chaperone
MVLKFGKFKGSLVEDVPTSYLAYLLDQDFVDYDLKASCLDEINYRYSEFKMSKKAVDRSIIDQAYKRLVIKHHPDKGGNHNAMIAINEFREILLHSI